MMNTDTGTKRTFLEENEMTLDDIKEAVAFIERVKGDDEAAHGAEDDLREAFIRHVAKVGNKKLSEMANEVLKTEDIVFARWCA